MDIDGVNHEKQSKTLTVQFYAVQIIIRVRNCQRPQIASLPTLNQRLKTKIKSDRGFVHKILRFGILFIIQQGNAAAPTARARRN